MPSTRAHSHALRGFTPSRLARSHALLGLRAAPHDVGWDSPWQKARRRTSRNGTCGTPWAHFGRGSASARPRVYVAGAYIFLHVDLMPYASQERRVSLCTRWGWGGGKDGREGERGKCMLLSHPLLPHVPHTNAWVHHHGHLASPPERRALKQV